MEHESGCPVICDDDSDQVMYDYQERTCVSDRLEILKRMHWVNLSHSDIEWLISEVERLRAALHEIAEHRHILDGCGPGDDDYQSLTRSGHRCAAGVARKALEGGVDDKH